MVGNMGDQLNENIALLNEIIESQIELLLISDEASEEVKTSILEKVALIFKTQDESVDSGK